MCEDYQSVQRRKIPGCNRPDVVSIKSISCNAPRHQKLFKSKGEGGFSCYIIHVKKSGVPFLLACPRKAGEPYSAAVEAWFSQLKASLSITGHWPVVSHCSLKEVMVWLFLEPVPECLLWHGFVGWTHLLPSEHSTHFDCSPFGQMIHEHWTFVTVLIFSFLLLTKLYAWSMNVIVGERIWIIDLIGYSIFMFSQCQKRMINSNIQSLTGLLPSPATPLTFSSLFPVIFSSCKRFFLLKLLKNVPTDLNLFSVQDPGRAPACTLSTLSC